MSTLYILQSEHPKFEEYWQAYLFFYLHLYFQSMSVWGEAVIFCAVSLDVIIPPVVPVVNPVITVTQGCQWLICICGFLYLFLFLQL